MDKAKKELNEMLGEASESLRKLFNVDESTLKTGLYVTPGNSPIIDRSDRYILTVDTAQYKRYQMGKDEPAMRHFIRSMFSQPQLWLTFTETAYDGHSNIEALTVEQVKEKFGIDLES